MTLNRTPSSLFAHTTLAWALALVSSGCGAPDGTDAAEDAAATDAAANDAAATAADAGTHADIAGADAGTAADADIDADVEPPSLDPCARVAGPPPSTTSPWLGLSHALHVGRSCGAIDDLDAADRAVADAIAWAPADGSVAPEAIAAAWAESLPTGCTVALGSPLGAARVAVKDRVAIVSPGTTTPELPVTGDLDAIVLDLRTLSADPDLPAALERAVGAVLAHPLRLPGRSVRRHDGYRDELFTREGVYATSIAVLDGALWGGRGRAGGEDGDLPLFVLVDRQPAPEAAIVAGALALAGEAHLVGEDLLVAAAELDVSAVGNVGFSIRVRELADAHGRWPDVIAADLRGVGDDVLAAIIDDVGRFGAPAPQRGADDRPPLTLPPPTFLGFEPAVFDLDVALAVVAQQHSVLTNWFPYLDAAGRTDLDSAYVELASDLAARGIGADTDEALLDLVKGLSKHAPDSHRFFYDRVVPAASRGLPLIIDHTDEGLPFVRVSHAAGARAGDLVLAVDGEEVGALYERLGRVTTAATPGYLRQLIARAWLGRDALTRVRVRHVDGREEELDLEPSAAPSDSTFPFLDGPASERATIYGAADIGILHVGSPALASETELDAAIAGFADATAVIVDMRGYPNTFHAEIVARFATASSVASPQYSIPRIDGVEGRSEVRADYTWPVDATKPHFHGPIVLLTAPSTVSAAEDFSMMLLGTGRVSAVLGRTSAASDGNITGAVLSGQIGVTWTGMRVQSVDGRSFHGVGIVPDIHVSPVLANVAAGLDDDLAAAVAYLRDPG